MEKLNQIQLSAILSHHTARNLTRMGTLYDGVTPCMMEVAGGLQNSEWDDHFMDRAVGWFDDNYNPEWTVEEFIHELQKANLA